jgi:sugar phosphate isomerase/epimerase
VSFKLGFKVNPFLERHGWKQGALAEWDKAATIQELRFWREQGYEVVEMLPDHYSGLGRFMAFTDEEWAETRTVIEDAGIQVHGILGWRRMFWREPWIKEKASDLDRIAEVAEILGCKVIDILTAYPLPIAPASSSQPVVPAGGGPARPLFRSLWDAVTHDFETCASWLKAYARRIAGFGASIALEIHPDCLTDIPLSTLRLMEMIDEPNVGLNPDTFDSEWIYPEYPGYIVPTAAQQCKLLAPHVVYWHAKNWTRRLGTDGKWTFTRTHLDEGDQPIDLMVQNLVDVGFDGGVILECGRGLEYATAPASLLRARDYLVWLRDVYAPAVPTRTVYPSRPMTTTTATPGS